jgi:hypothetical protein
MTHTPLLENATQQEIQTNKTWHERTRKNLYWFFVSVFNLTIMHIQDIKSPKHVKQASNTLVKMYNTNTQACKT